MKKKKRIYEIARELGISSKDLIAKLVEMGMPSLYPANSVGEEEYDLILSLYQDEASDKEERPAPLLPQARKGEPRPPVVAVLGHIDHGKTTLLDAIRRDHVAQGEAGGITQSIGAYQATYNGKTITFIDTPGHKAFTTMRARGARATDIAVLVIAADDGIMMQTIEAIDHIKAAGVPIIVAINKIDKVNANVDRVFTQLVEQKLVPEELGGETIVVSLSALTGKNINDLLEMILLLADMEDLRADPDGPLHAIIIESYLDSSRGPVATAIIKNGTLRERDFIVTGSTCGRVKALIDGRNHRIKAATPGQAVLILGLQHLPTPGMTVEICADQNSAKQLAEKQRDNDRKPRPSREKMSVADLFREAAVKKKIKLILKASSIGALEAAIREIENITVSDVTLEIIHSGVGPITESDILLASSSQDPCLVAGFGSKPDSKVVKSAASHNVSIKSYDIIYDLLDEIEERLTQLVSPESKEIIIGEVIIRDLFHLSIGTIAGCYVTSGKVTRDAHINVIRNGEKLFSGKIASLRRIKEDVAVVQSGRECGIKLEEFDDLQVGDILQVFLTEEVAP
ncbi:translation initiation factor IF-2 [Candidatus Acetothermia bacterium]|nr:translation initiation factor IF-2 [Candidatus Acetothermia bacterium]MCI2427266.1 translation initiation factor IF-2 [Candidatus Acetothermia bacterium]MCI2428528.1 translation initiation factor IF-2 [Candidatus Acetothermia bacterium]